jgi:hypothetical protein
MNTYGHPKLSVSLRDHDSTELLQSPRLFSMNMSDDFCIEPMLAHPDETSASMSLLLSTAELSDDYMLACASTYGIKNIVFRLKGCLLCKLPDKIGVYVPASFMQKAVQDLSLQEIQCQAKRSLRGAPFYPAQMTATVLNKARTRRSMNPQRKVTIDHRPMYKDGFKTYSVTTATICVALTENRESMPSDYADQPIIVHNKRRVEIVVLDISS